MFPFPQCFRADLFKTIHFFDPIHHSEKIFSAWKSIDQIFCLISMQNMNKVSFLAAFAAEKNFVHIEDFLIVSAKSDLIKTRLIPMKKVGYMLSSVVSPE